MAVEDKKNSILIKTLMRLFSVQAIGLGCGFLVHIMLAKQLSPAEYGIYNFVFSTSMICALLGNFGFQASAVRIVPQMISDEYETGLKKFVTFSSFWVFFLSSFVGFLVFNILIKLGFTAEYPKEALLIGIGLTPLLALVKLNSGILKGFKKGTLAIAYESSLKEILLLGVLLFLFLTSVSFTSAQFFLITIFSIFVSLFIFSFFTLLTLILRVKEKNKIFEKKQYKTWLKISFPMMLVISVQFLILRADIIMLGILTTATEVGIYSVGAKLAQAVTIGMMVLNIIFSPRASELFHKKNYNGLRRLYFKTLRFQAGFTVLLAGALALIAPYIIHFLGVEYAYALPVMYVLLAGYALNSLWGPIPFLMIMTKYEYQAMWLTFMAAILNIALNLILIPHFGILGAAMATVIAINVRNGSALFYIFFHGVLGSKKEYE